MMDDTDVLDVDARRAILNHIVSQGLGVIPDPQGDWFSYRALACILGYQVRSLQNRFSDARNAGCALSEHPIGKFFRLADAVKAMSYAEEKPTKKGRKRGR